MTAILIHMYSSLATHVMGKINTDSDTITVRVPAGVKKELSEFLFKNCGPYRSLNAFLADLVVTAMHQETAEAAIAALNAPDKHKELLAKLDDIKSDIANTRVRPLRRDGLGNVIASPFTSIGEAS